MKRMLVLVPILLVACSNTNGQDVLAVSNHSRSVETLIETKAPVYWEINLVDEYNQANYEILLNDYGYQIGRSMDEDSLRSLAREIASEIDTPMQNPKLAGDGSIIKGIPRVILSEKELVEQLLSLPIGTYESRLPIYVTEPNIRDEHIIGIDEKVIGEFKTYFNPNVTGRAQNVLLSAKAISGTIIGPGDSFSFNQTVGERTVARGYQEAMEIVDKEFVVGIGGGICQTSTTLFNAVEKAGLSMVERYSHSREVGYVPEGRDATVSWGGPDFRFINPHPYPVLIHTNVDLVNGELVVSVHSHS